MDAVETSSFQDGIPETIEALSLSSKDWKKAQRADPIISQLLDHMHNGTKPSAKQMSEKFDPTVRYLRDWENLDIRDGVLYRFSKFKGQTYKQLLLPENLRMEVFRALHDDLGHQGRDRTISLFKQRFFWPGMDAFIEDKIRKCQRCIARKTRPAVASLVPISSTAPMEIICLDFLSLEQSKGGYENILVITDHFTRYAQAYPTKNQTARTTAKILFDQFIVHYGFPAKIHSDQGPNFESSLIQELCNLAQVSKSHTTPYHAMGNGMTERFNQTLLKMLGTLENDKKSDWKSYVGPLVHAYNVTIHKGTSFSPYYLMFGREPKLAIDALLGLTFDEAHSKSRNEYVQKLKERLTFAYNKAKQKANKTALTNKSYYDKKAKAVVLKPDDIVLVRNISQRGKQKIADKWETDPYIVVQQPNMETPVYVLRKKDSSSRKTKTLHRRLTFWIEEHIHGARLSLLQIHDILQHPVNKYCVNVCFMHLY